MIARILPPAEWGRLAGTEAEPIWPQLTDAACVVVVEHDGAIVGCQVLQPVLHAECLWIAPAYRKRASVARRLWATVRRTAQDRFGVQGVMTSSLSADVDALLAHVGATPLPGKHFVMRIA